MKCPKCGSEICQPYAWEVIRKKFGRIKSWVCLECGHEEKVMNAELR